MAENLNVDKFRNGDPRPEAKTEEEWKRAGENKQPAWCYYNNNPANSKKYGKLYNWYAVNDLRGLAPEGYHIPTDAEWTTLTNYLGGESEAGTKMKSTQGWKDGGNGTNSSKFSGLPGGFRYRSGLFSTNGGNGIWWSSTEYRNDNAWFRFLSYYYGDFYRFNISKIRGLSVRYLRD
jgi:uncharacterized protein (TIGR02145 family)